MSIHIAAKQGEIAETVLLPGDPLRAKWIAETFFDDPVSYNTVRNMLGFTDAADRLEEFGVFAVEMETSALYSTAARHGRRALSILTVSDHIRTHEQTSAAERETTFSDMVEIALAAALED